MQKYFKACYNIVFLIQQAWTHILLPQVDLPKKSLKTAIASYIAWLTISLLLTKGSSIEMLYNWSIMFWLIPESFLGVVFWDEALSEFPYLIRGSPVRQRRWFALMELVTYRRFMGKFILSWFPQKRGVKMLWLFL